MKKRIQTDVDVDKVEKADAKQVTVSLYIAFFFERPKTTLSDDSYERANIDTKLHI